MNGRVYDPALGQFLSVDPLIGNLADSQSVHPYAYVGQRPLSFTDPSGYVVAQGCAAACVEIAKFLIATALSFGLGGSSGPPPPMVLPGQSAQNGTGICGPGNTSPTCTGMILYAGAPGAGSPMESTQSEVLGSNGSASPSTSATKLNLELAARVLIPGYRASEYGYLAVRQGNYLLAAGWYVVMAGEVGIAVGTFGASAVIIAEARAAQVLVGAGRTVVAGEAVATRAVTNPVPRELARVLPGRRLVATLGRAGEADVFVTAADDIAGLNASQIAQRLTIDQSETFTVIRFPTPPGGGGIASPVFRTNPGFLQGGLTRGGAREFVVPNGPIPPGAVIEVVR